MLEENHEALDAAADSLLIALHEAYPEGLPQCYRTCAARLQDALDAGGADADPHEMWAASDALLGAVTENDPAWMDGETYRWHRDETDAAYGAAHAPSSSP